jgi:hippurate hydrolase
LHGTRSNIGANFAVVAAVTAELVEQMRAWRRGFHRQPELGFDVRATATTVAGLLRGFGFDEVHTEVGGSGVVGVLRRGASSKSIGLRADMDALPITEGGEIAYRSEVPGVFHGCGHDGHTAMLLGAANVLSSIGDFDGVVNFVFQPDEENGRGAQAMVDEGLFERFPMSAIYGMHNMPGLAVGEFATRVGPMMSSEDLFEIVVHGRGGHASTPERHVDPVVTAAEIILGLQTIVSRSIAATETAVVSVTELSTDGARNIVPSTVTIKGDCRTFARHVQQTVEVTMRRIVDGVCAAHGATGLVRYTHEFIPLVNTSEEVRAAAAAAAAVVGASNVDTHCALITASEDFARFLEVVPGCFITIGNGLEGACGSSLHNPHYDFNDEILAIGADYWVRLVTSQLPS